MKPHAFHPKANDEYAQAAEYYTRIDPELGRRFYDQVERLILDIRRHFCDVFPYAVLYVDQPDRVLIIAVMHMKRRPGYWKQRIV